MSTPSELRREVLAILDEIPRTYVQLHVAVTAPRPRGGYNVRVSGGTRDFVPINTEADAHKIRLLSTVRRVHGSIAAVFGEPRPSEIGIQSACEDLVRWSDLWTWMPLAYQAVASLRTALHLASEVAGAPIRERLRTVCPGCLQIGDMWRTDDQYGCEGCGRTWNPDEYTAAVRDVCEQYREVS